MPQAPKTGVLLCNLGTPDAPTPQAVSRFLEEFLSDPRVVELPKIVWSLLRKTLVIPLRAKRVAKNYQSIWTDQGSPLLVNTLALANEVDKQLGENFRVVAAMRYGNPSIAAGIDHLVKESIEKIVILPLYPQFAASSSAAIFDAVAGGFSKRRDIPNLRFISQYYDNPKYIDALTQQVKQHVKQQGVPDKFILSFHGLPQAMVDKGDPYQHHCYVTAKLLAEACAWSTEQWQLTFQSRLGTQAWLQPYTDVTLEQLAKANCQHVAVICPGFAIDCLETLEEIAIQNRDRFLNAGGKQFHYIPALNQQNTHISLLSELIRCD